MSDLSGKIAIVTGSAGGIGLAVSRLFVERGANVVMTDRLERGAEEAAKLGPAAHFMRQDVTRAEDWDQVVAEAERRFGALNVLVNNAGVSVVPDADGTPRNHLPIETCTEAQYRQIVDINQVAVFLGMKAAIAPMRRAGGGAIVNTASAAGLVGLPGAIGYVGSKFAVTGMTKGAALELGAYNIRVNSVHPGMIATPMMAAAQSTGLDIQPFIRGLPIPRTGQPSEVAEVFAFLASDAASFCTGAAFAVDGGWTAM